MSREHGTVFVYDSSRGLVAFMFDHPSSSEQKDVPTGSAMQSMHSALGSACVSISTSPPPSFSPSHLYLIFIGGLTDGLLSLDYVSLLNRELQSGTLARKQMSVIQPLISSSYLGYGTGSLQRDADQLLTLIRYLAARHNLNEAENDTSAEFVLLGHSTGCQDILQLMKQTFPLRAHIRGLILQGPVSDREYLVSLPDTSTYLALADDLIRKGQAQELLPRAADVAPITAYRYHSFVSRGGDDDYFSTDLSDEELASRLCHVDVPTMFVTSLEDEYVPVPLRPLLAAHTERMANIVSQRSTGRVTCE